MISNVKSSIGLINDIFNVFCRCVKNAKFKKNYKSEDIKRFEETKINLKFYIFFVAKNENEK